MGTLGRSRARGVTSTLLQDHDNSRIVNLLETATDECGVDRDTECRGSIGSNAAGTGKAIG